MARIVGFVGLSHSPFWIPNEPEGDIGADFVAAVGRARRRVEQWRPDAMVVIGPDHFRNFFYDAMPPFCLGLGAVRGFGDYDTVKGELPVAPALAAGIHAGLVEAGFDPAVSLAMGVDHGIAQPYQALCPDLNVPLVPVMITAGGPARPSLRRCHALGKAIGAALEAHPSSERVVVVASGGLSHWVRRVAPDDPETEPEIREYVVNGRDRAGAYSAMRDAGVRERRRIGDENPVNAEWDREVIAAFESGDVEAVLRQPDEEIQAVAGNGAHEIRSWIAGLGAWSRPAECLAYEPLPRWATGMACFASSAA